MTDVDFTPVSLEFINSNGAANLLMGQLICTSGQIVGHVIDQKYYLMLYIDNGGHKIGVKVILEVTCCINFYHKFNSLEYLFLTGYSILGIS